MAKLRLFAGLREAAGSAELRLDGATVGNVIDQAVAAYGPHFAAVLPTAKIWVNGEPADRATPVGAEDEVALLPPVSGGETVMAEPTTQAFQLILVLALTGAMIIANYARLEVFVFVTVGAALAWIWDIRDMAEARGQTFNIIPTMVTVTAAANGAYAWGFAGYAGGIALGVGVTLTWAVFVPHRRSLNDIAVSMLVGLAGGAASGALVLVRMRTVEEITAFIVITFLAGIAAWAAYRYHEQVPWLDANVALVATAGLSGLAAGFLADVLSPTAVFLAALAAGAGLVGGRVLGSLLRSGSVIHTERAPGLLTMFDGALIAAPLFWLGLAIFG